MPIMTYFWKTNAQFVKKGSKHIIKCQTSFRFFHLAKVSFILFHSVKLDVIQRTVGHIQKDLLSSLLAYRLEPVETNFYTQPG